MSDIFEEGGSTTHKGYEIFFNPFISLSVIK
jgi:hypothetical protein